jgi:hypothetical protein
VIINIFDINLSFIVTVRFVFFLTFIGYYILEHVPHYILLRCILSINYRVKLNMVSESRRSGLKSAGRRRFFGSKQVSQDQSHTHPSHEDGQRSTSKVLRSLFFHNATHTCDVDGSYVPSDAHVSLTSQTSNTTNESGHPREPRIADPGSNSGERTITVRTDQDETPVRTSLGSNVEDLGRVMRGCSDADLGGERERAREMVFISSLF